MDIKMETKCERTREWYEMKRNESKRNLENDKVMLESWRVQRGNNNLEKIILKTPDTMSFYCVVLLKL